MASWCSRGWNGERGSSKPSAALTRGLLSPPAFQGFPPMSLTLATLVPGFLLIILGVPMLLNHSGYAAILKAFPRSIAASYLFFGAGAVWFLYAIWHLSPAD